MNNEQVKSQNNFKLRQFKSQRTIKLIGLMAENKWRTVVTVKHLHCLCVLLLSHLTLQARRLVLIHTLSPSLHARKTSNMMLDC